MYRAYFDSGTSNSRIYLLDSDFNVKYSNKKKLGSKDCAIAGSNDVLLLGLKELYDGMLKASGLLDKDISEIYASGMVTSMYGIKEVAHIGLPIRAEEFMNNTYCHFESRYFKRDIILVPGIKSRIGDDISLVGNVRGEEIELIGAMDEIKNRFKKERCIVVMPGSHTQIICLKDGVIEGLISNFTGELIQSLESNTIFSPILSGKFDGTLKDMVLLGKRNLERYGFNRALYIAHTMRTFKENDTKAQKSYLEGVINAGVVSVIEHYCDNYWKDCKNAAMISGKYLFDIYAALFENSAQIKNVVHLNNDKARSYSIEGLKKIVSYKEGL